MTEQFAHGVYVHSEREHHSGKGMAAAVESDRLRKEKQTGED